MQKTPIQIETERALNLSVVPHRHHHAVKPDFPTYFRMIRNLAGTLSDFARDGFRLSDREEWERRFEICTTCPHFVNNRCSKCGCYSKLKNRIQAATCPMGRW